MGYTVFRVLPRNTINMNSKIYIAVLVVAALLLGEAEAGCNQNGCCYCHKDQGYVITSGLYQEDCDYGYECRCNHGRRIGYYGECVHEDEGPSFQRRPAPQAPQAPN